MVSTHKNVILCQGPFSSAKNFLLFLLILSSTQVRFKAEAGRPNPTNISSSKEVNEDKVKIEVRIQIGSRPPKCERRCSTCGPCEAIQVPTSPQVKHIGTNYYSSSIVSSAAYARRDDGNSNYKPMSWKCKCGDLIFNP